MGNRMKQLYRNMSIQKKIIVVFAVIFVFFIVSVLAVSNRILYTSNMKKIEQNIQDECRMIDIQLTNLYNNVVNCQNSAIQGINQVYNDNGTQELDGVSFVSVKNNLSSALKYYQSCFGEVDSIVFADVHNNVVAVGLNRIAYGDKLQEMIGEIPSYGSVREVTFPVEAREIFGGNENEGIFSMGKRVISIDTGENLGYLFVNVKTGTIAELFPEKSQEAYHKSYYILDEEDRVAVTDGSRAKLGQSLEPSRLEELSGQKSQSFRSSSSGEDMLVTSRENT